MQEKTSKTWLSSVVFLDIAQYTQRSVAQQMQLKEQLVRYVEAAVANVAENDRIIVDTGDGAALCFLSDPEDALFAALSMREALLNDAAIAMDLHVRIGINLGPIKVVTDLNGQLNPLGDGINKAQRVMSFAKPNQILVSRSFYDVIACLSEEYAQLFHYRGIHKDKHVHEYPLYEVVVPGEQDTKTRALLTRPVERESSLEIAMATGWDPAVLASVSAELAAYIGPLAKVLVKKAVKKADNMQELCRLLADSIPLEEGRRAFLDCIAHNVPASHSAASPGPDVLPAAAPGPNTVIPLRLSGSAALTEIEACLTEYLGPVARVLVKQTAKQTDDVQELCQRLAREIDSREQREAFLGTVRKISSTV